MAGCWVYYTDVSKDDYYDVLSPSSVTIEGNSYVIKSRNQVIYVPMFNVRRICVY